jgi:DNA repair exonuclease SbcCD ATPase subunit
MSKLSSVMAYAGLPLTADDVKTEPTSQPRLTKQTVSANNDVDVKKIFSKAALAAIEDEHRQRGHQGHAFGPAESFYVVQTGGGTYSYADITKAQQQQLAGIDEDDEEAFVDAREAPAPSSPRNSRFSSRGRGSFGHSRTHEELELENVTLKQTLEQLATRLTEFETHAQDASMAALTQSMASTHTPGPSGGPDPTLIARLRQVEQQLEQKQEEMQKWQSHVAKQDKQLKKYQSKWEEIKQSAKEKQKAKAEKSEKASEAASTIADAG